MKKELMSWDECETNFIREIEKDADKVRSILKMSGVRLKVVRQIKLDGETASIIADGYYEIIKELLTALLLSSGLKSSNHECLVSFLRKEYSEKDYEIKLIHELKKIRNRIGYEGFFVDKSYIERNKLKFEHIINFLKKEVGDKIK